MRCRNSSELLTLSRPAGRSGVALTKLSTRYILEKMFAAQHEKPGEVRIYASFLGAGQ